MSKIALLLTLALWFAIYQNYETIPIISARKRLYPNSKKLILGTPKSIHKSFRM
jgi:hypothetical protein